MLIDSRDCLSVLRITKSSCRIHVSKDKKCYTIDTIFGTENKDMAEISKKTAQQIVDSVKDVCGHDVNFIRPDGSILASTNPERVGTYHEIGHRAAQEGQPIEVMENDSFYGTQQGVNLPFSHHGTIVAVIGITGVPEDVRKYAYLAQRITALLLREQEYDARNRNAQVETDYVVRALSSGKPMNHGFYLDFLASHGLSEEVRYRTVLVRLSTRYNPANLSMVEQKILTAFRETGSPLFTFRFPNEYILILPKGDYPPRQSQFERLAAEFREILSVGVGADHKLVHQYRSFREAQIAARAGDERGGYADFEQLDLELLSGSIPVAVRDSYATRTLGKLSDKERHILAVYFAADCSLKTAAEKLYIHKNTLQYQLDKIHALTGYDPRVFREGVILYLGLQLGFGNTEANVAGTAAENTMGTVLGVSTGQS